MRPVLGPVYRLVLISLPWRVVTGEEYLPWPKAAELEVRRLRQMLNSSHTKVDVAVVALEGRLVEETASQTAASLSIMKNAEMLLRDVGGVPMTVFYPTALTYPGIMDHLPADLAAHSRRAIRLYHFRPGMPTDPTTTLLAKYGNFYRTNRQSIMNFASMSPSAFSLLLRSSTSVDLEQSELQGMEDVQIVLADCSEEEARRALALQAGDVMNPVLLIRRDRGADQQQGGILHSDHDEGNQQQAPGQPLDPIVDVNRVTLPIPSASDRPSASSWFRLVDVSPSAESAEIVW